MNARTTFAALALMLLAATFAHDASADPTRHHLTLGFGYQRFVSDDFDDSGFEEAGLGTFAYRFSVSPAIDVVFDTRGTVASQDGFFDIGGTPFEAEIDFTTEWFGPGVRYNFMPEGTRPYVQANMYFVNERLQAEVNDVEVSESEGSVGFGLQAGLDIRLSKLLSLPVEMNFLTGKPENDLTSVGFGAGLTFNFGTMP